MKGLPEGLRLRHARLEDAAALAEFNADVHREGEDDPPDTPIGAWTHDLLARPQPTFVPDDMLIIEEAVTGRFASTLCLIPQTWEFDGIPFALGRIELVGTAPEHRRQGLVRHLMQAVHQRSRAQGHLAQGITGIPWFYRQFGYEMTVGLDGRRGGYPANVPRLSPGELEPFNFRPATAGDVPFLAHVDAAARRRRLLACVRDEALWHNELYGRGDGSAVQVGVRIIVSATGDAVGYVAHDPTLRGGSFVVRSTELAPDADVAWPEVAPSLLRFVAAEGASIVLATEQAQHHGYWFLLPEDHALFQASPSCFPERRRPYAWYLRVEDVPAFLRHVTPVLERRLADSPLRGYCGEVRLDRYRDAMVLRFERGAIVAITGEPASGPVGRRRATGLFPDLTFLHLLFGHRSVDDLQEVYADCLVGRDPARALLDALFPKRPSQVWGWA